MSYSLYNPFLFSAFLDRRTFKDDDGDSGSSSSSSSRTEADVQADINSALNASGGEWTSELNDLVSERTEVRSGGASTSSTAAASSSDNNTGGAGNTLPNGNVSLGSVSATGQYAGDGFEWQQNPNTNALTRVYTGANEDAGLGTEVFVAGTSDNDTKAAVAQISLDEGSSFANSAASATDGSVLDLFRGEEDKVGSSSYAEQVGEIDYTPVVTYDSTKTGAENYAEQLAKIEALTSVAPAAVNTGLGSLSPVARPTNLLTVEEQALVDAYNAVPDTDESYTPDAATMAAVLKSQNKESVIPDPLSVAEQVAQYDGVDADALDAATAAANNAAAATALGSDDFSYTILDKGQGGLGSSPLPDSSQVAGGGWEEYFQNASTQDILDLAGSNVTLPVEADATPSYDAFGNEYATAEQAAAADIAAEAAASDYSTMSQQDFVDQYATDDAAGISDALKYAAIVGPENVGNMLSGMGRQSQITSPLDIFPTTGREVGINALIPFMTNQFGKLFMSEEDKRARMLAADPNRAASLTSQGLQDVGGYLSETVSPFIRNYLQPESGQAVFQGDLGGPLTVTDLSGDQLTGSQATQGIVNTTAGEVSDTGLDLLLNANPITRTISAALNAGEQLTGLEQGISSNIDEAYVSGALDGNATFQEALKAQGGDVDKALGVIKDLAYVSGDVPAYQQVAASGAVDAVLPKVGKGILGFGKEIAKRGAVEGGQGAFESYTAINAINQALGTDFDPTKNIVGAAATEGVAGTGAATVGSAVAQGLSARQRRNAADEEALMSQPVVAPYGGMDTSGITPGFTAPRQPSASSAPQTIEGQYSVFDPNISPTAGDPASSTVPSAYDLEGPEAGGLAITDQRDPMTTSMETMAAQEIINDQVNQTGAVDFGVLQRIQNATGLSMSELGSMVDSATSTKLTPDQIAAIESAPVGAVMTNAPMAPGFEDEVTGNFGGSNISVKPNADGTTTLTAPSGRISVVDPGQDLDQAIKVFDEIVTPIDVQTDAPVLKDSGQGLAAPDLSAAPFASTNIGGLPSLGVPSGADAAPASGIETVVAKSPDDIIAEQRAAAPELTTIYHATKGAPFSQFDPTQGDSYYGNQGAFGPGFYGSLDTKYPSEFVGGEGSLMSAQVDTSNMLDARNNKPLSQTQTANLQGALANRTDSAGNNLNVTQDGNTLTVEYVRKSSFGGESEADRTVTRTIDTTNPTDIFQKVNIISENIKNPLAKDDQGLSIESELDGDTQNLKGILTDAGFTGVVGVADVGGGTAGNKDNMVVFDESLVGDLQTVVDQGPIPTSAADLAIDKKMDTDNTFEEVSDAQAVANAEAIKAQEVAYTETKAATGDDAAAEAAGETAYNSSIAASSVSKTDDGGAEVEIADNLFEAANKADQDVVTVNADGTATVAVDPNAVETGTDVAIIPETTTDVTTNADGTTDVVVDGTTDLTTAATTDLTVDGDTDTDTDTTAVTVVDNTIDGTATEISGALTDQTSDKKTSVVPVVDNDITMLTEIEPPEVEVDEPVVTADPVTADPDVPDIFVPTITTTDENGDTVIECPEGYVQVETENGPMCQKIITARSSIQRGGRFVRDQGRGYTGRVASLSSGSKGPGQKRKTRTTSRTERIRPTVRT